MLLAKNILQLQEAQLDLFKKDGTQNQIDFHNWFITKSEHFNLAQVNRRLSKATSIRVDAQIKECYHNTWRASLEDFTLRYFEGFVWNKNLPIPIEHSWLVTLENKVVDPTLILSNMIVRKQLKEKGYDGHKHFHNRLGDEYMGVHIPTRTLNQFVFKTKATGGFLIEYWLKQRSEV